MNILDFIETERISLTAEGFYPVKKVGILNRINSLVIMILSFLEWILMLLFLLLVKVEIVDMTETMLFFITQTAFLCKLVNFILKKDVLVVVESHLHKPILCDVTNEESDVIKENLLGFQLFGHMYRGAAVFATIFFALFPLLDQGSKGTGRLPLKLWIPFEMDNSYYLIYFLIILAIGLEAFTNICLDVLPIKFLMVAVGQFENLKTKLRESVPLGEEEVEDEVVLRNLNKCVVHFYAINRFVNNELKKYK